MSELNAGKAVLTVPEAASYLGLAVSTLNKWRCVGGGPEYLKLGKAVRYRVADLDEWINSSRRSHTA